MTENNMFQSQLMHMLRSSVPFFIKLTPVYNRE